MDLHRGSSSGEGSNASERLRRMLNMSHLEEGMVVLEAVRSGAGDRESLIERTSLPWPTLREVVGSLAEAGLLRVEDGGNLERFRLRPKGLELTRRYRGVVERIETVRAVIEVTPF